MKKTVTTILSLALALILVSSLSSGVILAKGDDDHDNRKKNKNKYETVTVRHVGILDCVSQAFFGASLEFGAFNGPAEISMDIPGDSELCDVNLTFLLNEGFKIQDVGIVPFIADGFTIATMSRYTLVKTTKMRVLKENEDD